MKQPQPLDCGLNPPKSLSWARPTGADAERMAEEVLRPSTVEPDGQHQIHYKWQAGCELIINRERCLSPDQIDLAGESDNCPLPVDRLIENLGGDFLWTIAAYSNAAPRADRYEDELTMWLLLTTLTKRATQLAHERHDQMAPFYDRALFLLLSYPFRPGGEELAETLEVVADDDLSSLAFDARRAQRQWAKQLDKVGVHQTSESLEPAEIDSEIDQLILETPNTRTLLNLQADLEAGNAADSEDDESHHGFATWYCRRLLLPRFRLLDCHLILRKLPVNKPLLRETPVLSLVLMIAVIVWSAVGVELQIVSPVSIMDGDRNAAYFLVLFAVGAPYILLLVALKFGASPSITYPLALRLPAVAVLGASILMPLGNAWYTTAHWEAVAAMGLFALGYLLLEASNHRVSRRLWRSLAVLVVGGAHGFMVAILWFATAGRIFLPPLECQAQPNFHRCLEDPNRWFTAEQILSDHALVFANLSLTTAIGMVLGLTLQVLWDDRPVTYPLTHLGGP